MQKLLAAIVKIILNVNLSLVLILLELTDQLVVDANQLSEHAHEQKQIQLVRILAVIQVLNVN